jgi:hypothetical protein
MAGLGRKQWSPGDTLTAADVNGYLMDQSVMVFAGTAERGSAIPTPSAGMVAYSTATGLEVYNGSSFTPVTKILQVVSVFKDDAFSMTGTTFTDVTGLSVSITPQSSSSKIICMGQLNTGVITNQLMFAQLVRGSTAIGNGTSGNSINALTTSGVGANTIAMATVPIFLVDSPATTSATTYKIQIKAGAGGILAYVNRRQNDTEIGGSSTLILMEVSA